MAQASDPGEGMIRVNDCQLNEGLERRAEPFKTGWSVSETSAICQSIRAAAVRRWAPGRRNPGAGGCAGRHLRGLRTGQIALALVTERLSPEHLALPVGRAATSREPTEERPWIHVNGDRPSAYALLGVIRTKAARTLFHSLFRNRRATATRRSDADEIELDPGGQPGESARCGGLNQWAGMPAIQPSSLTRA